MSSLRSWWRGLRRTPLLVLRYAGLGAAGQVGKEAFASQARQLQAAMQPVALADLGRYLRGRCELPPRAVALTFDDAQPTTLQAALPVLQQFSLPATFFVATAEQLGREATPGVDWAALRAAQAPGVEVGCAGPQGLVLATLPPQAVWHQLQQSRQRLEDKMGAPCIALAYASEQDEGSAVVRAEAGLAGFRLGLQRSAGINRVGALEPFALRRVTVQPGLAAAGFAELLSGKGL